MGKYVGSQSNAIGAALREAKFHKALERIDRRAANAKRAAAREYMSEVREANYWSDDSMAAEVTYLTSELLYWAE